MIPKNLVNGFYYILNAVADDTISPLVLNRFYPKSWASDEFQKAYKERESA